MKISSQILLTFLLNAVWQVALIALLAAVGSRLLRDARASYRHRLWVGALCLAFLVPALTSLRTFVDSTSDAVINPIVTSEAPRPFAREFAFSPTATNLTAAPASAFQLNQTLAFALLTLYCGFLLYRAFKLVQAWHATRNIRRFAVELEPNEIVDEVIRRCEVEIGAGSRKVKVLRSENLPVPVTIGLFHPVIILPEPLLREGNSDLLTSAIGHEFIHVARHDYLLNFIYEVLFIPISFHPAAALLRRRVKQTRELCCDELVAERILNAEVYARSLVRLASSAPTLRRLSVTTTVGIADADILEARIMSLLKKPDLNKRGKKLLLVAVSLLLLVPCVAATAFAMRFEVSSNAQDPVKQDEEIKNKELREQLRRDGVTQMKVRQGTDPRELQERERKRETEIEMRDIMHSALIRLAKINMDQAILVATSHQPGKVLLASLGAKGWEEPGKLGKDGTVFYHVIIADEVNPGSTHIWVNALDGTIMKTEKELPRKVRISELQ